MYVFLHGKMNETTRHWDCCHISEFFMIYANGIISVMKYKDNMRDIVYHDKVLRLFTKWCINTEVPFVMTKCVDCIPPKNKT